MVNARLSNDGSFSQAEELVGILDDSEVLEHDFDFTNEQARQQRLMTSYITQVRGFNAAWNSSMQWQAQAYSRSTTPVAARDPPPYTRPSTPQPQHRVYNLRCSHCDNFVSDRGMRAVLLLRPHITLFSTDAPPSNCGALYSSMDQEPAPEHEQVERTCDCLTQSLGCFGCGNVIGYQIIAPCVRCMGSVTRQNQRASNGHRYVFHHNEVTYSERSYRRGDYGISKNYLQTATSSSTVGTRASTPLASSEYAGGADSKDGMEAFGQSSTAAMLHTRGGTPSTQQRMLNDGDTLYWHHLAPAGDLRCATDTVARPRSGTQSQVGR